MTKNYDGPPVVSVDLRPAFPVIRDQGVRPLCLAYSVSDCNACANGMVDPLSVEYMAHYSYLYMGVMDYSQGLPMPVVEYVVRKNGQPPESEFPAQVAAARPLVPERTFSKKFFSTGAHRSLSFDGVLGCIARGAPVVLVVTIGDSFFAVREPFIIDDVAGSHAVHAIVAVGYGICSSGEKVLMIRNSWGDSWGDEGYAWLTKDYYTSKIITTLELV